MSNLINDIRQNAISHGSIPFWSWNDKLEPEELRRQIRNMKNLGMKGFFMHARTGLDTEYMGDEWFECVDACIDEAKKLDMEAWSYDENGWPSGFAGGKLLNDPANFAAYLRYSVENEYPSGDDVLSVCFIKDGKMQNADKESSENEYHVVRRVYDRSYVDTLDGDVTQKFIDDTYEAYRVKSGADFGGAMPGFFTDEPQYYRWATPWSNTLPKIFKERYGYEVTDKLAALFTDFDGAEEFRYDYYRLIHELFTNNFIKKIYDWCESTGSQITGHTVEESFLAGQMWCCGGVMPFYQYEHIPGIDYLGRGISNDLAPKQLGSAVAQLGKKKAISEMFGCCGWDVSPIELKRIAELQYAGGVNVMCQHLYPYSIRGQRKRDYPAFYSEHSPWQFALKDFNNFFNNLGYTLSLGEESVNTLVIHPIHSAYLNYKRSPDRASIADIEDNLNALVDLLGQNQIPYHFGDEWMMSYMASVSGNKITVGKCTYDYIIVPYTLTLDASTVKLLDEFVAGGGKVWFYSDVPERVDGHRCDLSRFKSNVSFDDIKAASEVKISIDGKNVPQLRKQVRNTEYGRIIYITNLTGKILDNVTVNISDCSNVNIIDMNDLSVSAVCGKKCSDGSLDVYLNFGNSQSYVLTEAAEMPLESCKKSVSSAEIKLENNFKFANRPDNALTLDYVQMSKNGVDFEPVRSLYCVKDMLLKERYEGKLFLKYKFTADEIPETLDVIVEPLKYSYVAVNGNEIKLHKNSWLDRSFLAADILPFVKLGENEIVMAFDYYQRPYVYEVLFGNVMESLRNCLSFDTEIECIYLHGKFAIKTDAEKFTSGERESVCYDGRFSIIAQKDEIDVTNIVKDGYPFYGGRIDVKSSIDYTAGGASLLKLNGRFAICDVSVNGVFAGRMMFERALDLADYLKEGKNEITLSLYNANRNLLGPHHRHDPEPWGVGPGTFSFEREWNNNECRGYVDRYAFVRFGIDL